MVATTRILDSLRLPVPTYVEQEGLLASIEQSTEMRMAAIEASMIKELKDKGWTIEQIRGRASAFEFIEHDKLPKLTPKLTFLLQALWEGRDPRNDELLDLAEIYKRDTGKDLDAEDEE
eukprot:Skav205726  [mRNA]  locus=scaffold1496:105975:107961:+ [translate_table: standard]